MIQGEVVKNRSALSNPDSLDMYANLPELQGWWRLDFMVLDSIVQ